MLIDNIKNNHTNKTRFVELDTHLCRACWKCIAACKRRVFGKVDLPFHKHARIVNPAKCKGCNKCVQACQTGALSFIYTAPR